MHFKEPAETAINKRKYLLNKTFKEKKVPEEPSTMRKTITLENGFHIEDRDRCGSACVSLFVILVKRKDTVFIASFAPCGCVSFFSSVTNKIRYRPSRKTVERLLL